MLKNHLRHLMEIRRKKDAVNRVRSGVEEIIRKRYSTTRDLGHIKGHWSDTNEIKTKQKAGTTIRRNWCCCKEPCTKYIKPDLDMPVDQDENVISDDGYSCVASTFQGAHEVTYIQTQTERTVNEGPSVKLKELMR
uniref:Uncharacterized protein LOC114343788 n=1 Tax=Diabrotica virgifera virgifera TaxID=50390 RepID=A0A6P7H328_DIAVI